MSSRLCPSFLCRSEKHHHPTHCLNLFVPLVDLTAAAGPTEFVPGTHNDANFAATLPGVMASARDSQQVKGRLFHCRPFLRPFHRPSSPPSALQHPRAVAPTLPAGSAVLFDVRVLHRGLANRSGVVRPVLYFTYAAPWYRDLHMFETPKSLLAGSGEGPEESPSPLPFLASPAATPKTGAFPCSAANGREGKGAAFPCASAAVLPKTDASACGAAGLRPGPPAPCAIQDGSRPPNASQ